MSEDKQSIRRYELPKSKKPRIIKEKRAFSSIYFKIKILFIISVTLLIGIVAMRFINTDSIKKVYNNTISNITKKEEKKEETFTPPIRKYIVAPKKNEVINNFNKDTKNSIDKMQKAQRDRMKKYRE
ncbi:MAG: hypothetical protein QM493_04480, partial [Sulfurovum sp.]